MSRKRFSERQVIETLAWQGVYVRCFRCHAPFFTPAPTGGMFNLSDKIEREHIHEIALGGPDVPKNCRYSCAPCHEIITNGTKATSAGSSKQRIAKVNRLRSKITQPKTYCFKGAYLAGSHNETRFATTPSTANRH